MKLWSSKLSRPVRFAPRQDSGTSLPICAVSCVDPAAASIGCSGTDASCICKDQTNFGNAIASCLINACSASDISAATSAFAQICAEESANPTSSSASVVVSSASSATASAASSTLPSAHSSSLPTSSSASRTSALTTSSTATAAGTTSPSSSATTQTGTPSSSTAISTSAAPPPVLSTGAIAGITVGAVLGFILLAVATFIVWRRRRAATNKAVISTHDDGGSGPQEPASSKTLTHHELAHNPDAKYGISPGSLPSELAPNSEKNQALEHELPVDPDVPVGLQSLSPSDDTHFGRGTNAELDGNPVSAAPNPHTTASLGQVEQRPFDSTHRGPGAASTIAEYSDAPEVVEPDPNEINSLLARAAELEAQRQTLLHLRSVEEEQEALRARLAQLQQNK